MKRLITIVLVSLLFLGLLGLVLFKLLAGGTPPKKTGTQPATSFPGAQATVIQASDPEQVVRQCYAWYLQYSAKNKYLTFDQLASQPTIQRCFTPEFIHSWKDDFDTSDDDPIFVDISYYDSWLTNISTRLTSKLAQGSTVDVVLGTGEELHALTVGLQKIGENWQISSVTYIEPQS
jgi:hypothetical protein